MLYSEEAFSSSRLLGQMKHGMCMEMKGSCPSKALHAQPPEGKMGAEGGTVIHIQALACACLAGVPQQVCMQMTVQQTGIHRTRKISR